MNSYKTTLAQLTSIKRIYPRKCVFTTQHLCSWKPQAAILQVGGTLPLKKTRKQGEMPLPSISPT